MTTNNPPYAPIQHPQHSLVRNAQSLGGRDYELWPNEHLPGMDSTRPHPAVNHADALPPTRYASTMGNEDPLHVAIDLGQHRGNESQQQLDADHPTPGITHYIPIDPGPPPLEQYQYAPAIPEVPNNCPTGNMPLPYNVPGPSRGDLSLVHSGMSVTENCGENLKKNLASYYLHNPDSRVNDLRTRRSRSGAVKVLILLEIDDEIDET